MDDEVIKIKRARAPKAGFGRLEKTDKKSIEGHAETTKSMFTHMFTWSKDFLNRGLSFNNRTLDSKTRRTRTARFSQ